MISVRNKVKYQLWHQISNKMWIDICEQARNQVRFQLQRQVQSQVRDLVRDEIRDTL